MNILDIIKDDATGQYSLTRIMCLTLFAVLIINIGYVFVTTRTLPDIPGGWPTILGVLYGLNKTASVAQNVLGKDA